MSFRAPRLFAFRNERDSQSHSVSSLETYASGNHWSIVKSPNEGAAWGNLLYSVKDVGSGDVRAVGAWPARSPYLTDTLAEHWNGAKWTVVRTPQIDLPTAQLNSITGVASNAVWAAGFADNPSCLCGRTIVDSWNGSAWTKLDTPNPGVADYLNSVSAVSANEIWAVGYEWPNQMYDEPVILHWDGSTWTADSLAQYSYGQLYSVYAPAHNDAWAFGYYDNGTLLALHWDGTSWSQVPFPANAGEIVSMSGTSANDVWAAGGFYGGQNPSALLFHWDGTKWTQMYVEGLLAPSWIYSISAIAPNSAWFTGFGEVFPKWSNYISHVTYHWNGTTWTDVYNPDQIACCELFGVSARTASDVWAVGQGGEFAHIKGTFTMHFGAP